MKLGECFLKGRSYFYLMHLSYEGEDRERLWSVATKLGEERIGLDKPEEVTMDWNSPEMDRQGLRQRKPMWYRQFEIFCNEMKDGDIVIAMNGWNPILGMGKIVVFDRDHPYHYRRDLIGVFFDHIRQVIWEYTKPIIINTPLIGFNNTLLKITPSSPFWSKIWNTEIPQIENVGNGRN